MIFFATCSTFGIHCACKTFINFIVERKTIKIVLVSWRFSWTFYPTLSSSSSVCLLYIMPPTQLPAVPHPQLPVCLFYGLSAHVYMVYRTVIRIHLWPMCPTNASDVSFSQRKLVSWWVRCRDMIWNVNGIDFDTLCGLCILQIG